jgi:hypothetical protein
VNNDRHGAHSALVSGGARPVELRGVVLLTGSRVRSTSRVDPSRGTPTEPKTSAVVRVLHHGSDDPYRECAHEGNSNSGEGTVGHQREDCCAQPRSTTLRHQGWQPEHRESR